MNNFTYDVKVCPCCKAEGSIEETKVIDGSNVSLGLQCCNCGVDIK